MSFFYDLNKRLADLASKQDAKQITEEAKIATPKSRLAESIDVAEADYSAKKAAAGKDIGKPGKQFSKIAKGAAERYGSKERGEKVAGAVLAKLRAKESVEESTLDGHTRKYGVVVVGHNDGKPVKMFDKESDAKAYADKGIRVGGGLKQGSVRTIVAPKKKTEESNMDESAFQAAIGKKKYGDAGMKALQKAGREHASDKTMDTIRNRYDKYDESQDTNPADRDAIITQAQKDTMAKVLKQHGKTDQQIKRKIARTFKNVKEDDMEEGNEFSGELVKARAQGAKEFKVDGKAYPVKEEGGMPMTPKQKSFAKLAPPVDKITFADKIAGAKKEVDEMLGDVAAEAIKGAIGKKKEPRSKGTAFDPEVFKTMISKDEHPRHDVKDTGYSKRYTRKIQDEPQDDAEVSTEPKKKGRPKGAPKGPERVTAKSYKYKSGRPAKVAEGDMELTDRGEYDQEGESAKCDIKTIVRHAQALHKILGDNDNLPEWVQSKLAKIEGMMTSVDDYMQNQKDETEEEPIAEKAVSKKQQKFMGMVHAAQKGERPASGAVAKVAKEMPKKAAKDFAATKHKGLPEKVKSKKKEESVEETAEQPTEKKAKGGYNFGGGVYEGFNSKVENMITESMSVNISVDDQGKKSISVNATDDDAEALAQLLKMAGLNSGRQEQACSGCGKSPCGCEEMVDENSPDWPTNTETLDADPNLRTYSGGLNGPKSTGQTTTPVIASQLNRQASMEESLKLERNLFNTWKNYKG